MARPATLAALRCGTRTPVAATVSASQHAAASSWHAASAIGLMPRLAKLSQQARLACSPEAMKLLLRSRWPGNTEQLWDVLKRVARHRRSGTITPADLPPECWTVSRRLLSPLESMERDAIVQGLLAYQGNRGPGQTVKVMGNQALNIDGRHSDGNGGFLTGPSDNDFVQFLQLDKVTNVPGMEVAWNEVVNQPSASRVEYNINLYKSGGTAASHILIHDNYIQGAFPALPATQGFSGGGILLVVLVICVVLYLFRGRRL